jgi:hypothetical protein
VSAARGLCALLALALAACGTAAESSRSALRPPSGGASGASGGAATEARPGEVEVRGTALDARTGALLAGVRVEGPGGVQAVSDRNGRFVLHGILPGTVGEVRGSLQDGRQDAVTLRARSGGRVDVVLRLEAGR